MESVYRVVSPTGRSTRDENIQHVSPLGDLNGKVIGEMWDGVFKGDVMFPLIRRELRKRFPAVSIVEYDEIGEFYASNELAGGEEEERLLVSRLRDHGCDGVIVGVAC